MITIKKKETLPLYGIGPYLIFPMLIISVLGLILTYYGMILVYKIDALNWLLIGLGIILLLDGILIWFAAFKLSKIQSNIRNDRLVTDGVYSLVRHPIYSAWLQISTAFILFSQNIYLFVLPIIFWVILSVVMVKTEEKWLTEKFGDDYLEYCQITNRFVPFPKLR